MLRLRQLVLVARDLRPVEHAITSELDAEVCYRDPGVGHFGLRHGLYAFGDRLLEVVAPKEPGTTAERYLEKIGWVREGAGDRFDDLELNVRAFVVMFTDDRQGTAEALAPGMGMEPADALESPLALVGDASSMIDDLVARRETFGFSYIGIGPAEMDDFAPVVAELAGT